MLDNTLPVDDEQTTECDAVLRQNSVGLGNLLLQVSNEGVVEVTQSTLLRKVIGHMQSSIPARCRNYRKTLDVSSIPS